MVAGVPREQLPGLGLLCFGLLLVGLGVTGAANPAPENTYALDDADVTTERYAGLSADAQHVVENGSDHNIPIAVEEFPDEFRSDGVTVVRYEGEMVCARERPVSDQPGTQRGNQTGIVGNCDDTVYDFDSLSARGKSVVSETLDSSDNQITFNRDSPREFTVNRGGDEPFVPEGEYTSSIYYVIKDGTVYQLTISDPPAQSGTLTNDLSGGLLVVSGIGLVVYGLILYRRSKSTAE